MIIDNLLFQTYNRKSNPIGKVGKERRIMISVFYILKTVDLIATGMSERSIDMNISVENLGALIIEILLFGVLYYLDNKKHLDFGILTLLGTGFGVLLGVIFRENQEYVVIFGNIYTRVLSALVIPLLLFSIISSVTNLGDSIRMKRIGLKSILFLLLNTLIASTITLLASAALHIGQGFEYQTTDYAATEVPSVLDTILSLFPNNIIAHWQNGEVIPILTFAIIIAIAYNAYAAEHPEVKPFKTFVDAGNKVLGQAVNWLMGFTPYAVLSLIARAVGQSNVAELLPLVGVLILAYVLCFIQLFGVESILIRLIAKLNPVTFLKGIAPAAVVAFTSQSSVGTIPVTIRQLKEKLGVDEDVASFTAGLGANLGMPGCAGIWPVLLAVFTVNTLDLEYGVFNFVFLVFLTLLVSLGTVGVPGTATIAATALFTVAGLPVEMIVIFSPISSIVDMARTATNVTGAATAAVLVAETEDLLDHEVYNQAVQVFKEKTV